MNQTKRKCSQCNNQIIALALYCCDPQKYVCVRCANNKCKICAQPRTNSLSIDYSPKVVKRNKCCNCDSEENTAAKREFFLEKKCKQYYCHQCILVFYQKYCIMIQKFKEQYGGDLEMMVELRCGCEVDPEIIINFAKKYCYDCSVEVKGRTITLRNKCLIMQKCYEYIENAAKADSFNRTKSDKAKALFYQIRKLALKCDHCKDIIDGTILKIGSEIGEVCLCTYCFSKSKEAELAYSRKQKRKQEFEKESVNSAKKVERDDGIEQIHLSPLEIEIKNKKYPYKCKICHIGIPKLILNQFICQDCLDKIDKGDGIDLIEEHPQQSQIKEVNKLVPKEKLELFKGGELSQPLNKENKPLKIQPDLSDGKEKIEQSKIKIVKSQESNIFFIKSNLESKIPKIGQNPEIPKPKSINQQQETDSMKIESEGRIIVPEDSAKGKLHPQFYSPPSESLNIMNIDPPQTVPCSQCYYQLPVDGCFQVYRRNEDSESTSRIAETQQELNIYNKQNKIKLFCKGCYLNLKQKLSAKRGRSLKRSEVSRFGEHSTAKQTTYNKDNLAQTAAAKIKLKDTDYYGNTGELPKRLTDFINIPTLKKSEREQPSQRKFCKQCKKQIEHSYINPLKTMCYNCEVKILDKDAKEKKSGKVEHISNKFFCRSCKEMVYQQEMNSLNTICKLCEIKQLQQSLRAKGQDQFKKVKCLKCRHAFQISTKETAKLNYCPSCLADAHTIKRK